jgi:uncharacterized protein (TIGR00730 family)
VGTALARNGLGLVYGGGRAGLMGILADAALDAGGRVVGIIPASLDKKELTHGGLTELHVVHGMHERKAMMAERSSGFLVLPGGIGTLEEFFEVLTWSALGLHRKPIGLLNVEGYFDPLLALLDHIAGERFIRSKYLEALVISDDPEQLAAELLDHRPPPVSRRWIDLDGT